MRIELSEHESAEDVIDHVLDINAYHRSLLAGLTSEVSAVATEGDEYSGLYYLLEFEALLMKAAVEKMREARKLKAA